MGLLMKLLTFPISGPVLGTFWVIDQIVEEAAREADPEVAAKRALAELAAIGDDELDDDERAELEDELLARLRAARAAMHPHGAREA
jgi:hypothetical protein